MLRRAREAWYVFRQHLREAKAEGKGEAISRARVVNQAKSIPQIASQLAAVEGPGGPQPIRGAGVRMLDGKPMQFYTDGSLRHALGRSVGKRARKILKRNRRAAAKSQASH